MTFREFVSRAHEGPVEVPVRDVGHIIESLRQLDDWREAEALRAKMVAVAEGVEDDTVGFFDDWE
jgi:hypothetical protein